MIQKKLKLTYPHEEIGGPKNLYRIEQCTNTVDYLPNQFLLEEDVKRLCNKTGWTIVIDPVRGI